MRFFKISHGTSFINLQNLELLKSQNLISMGSMTQAKGQSALTQYQQFLNAEKGDAFYLCHSNNSIELVGMFLDRRPISSIIESNEDWVDRDYVILAYPKNKTNYNNELDKWWTPKNNSTFIEIPESDMSLFEKDFLFPVFEKKLSEIKAFRDVELDKNLPTIEKYLQLQLFFKKIASDENELFSCINKIPTLELKKLAYEYNSKKNLESSPVVLLRKKIVDELIQGIKLDSQKISEIKMELDKRFQKDVYRAWKSNFRVLFTLVFAPEKSELESFFFNLIKKIQGDLGILDKTKKNLVHFDGAQNQGFDRIWFAIYNKAYKSQRLAKQLFFNINEGFEYGLLEMNNKQNAKLHKSQTFNYDHLVEIFTLYKDEILNDNSMKKAKLEEYIEVLEYKGQVILQGPPGTGKTRLAKELAEEMIKQNTMLKTEPVLLTLNASAIKNILNVGGKIESKTNKLFEILSLDDNTVSVKSAYSKEWKPSYNKIIKSYNEDLFNQSGRTGGLKSYEDAIAKHLKNILNSEDFTINKEDSDDFDSSDCIQIIQFHPSYTYEDFVRGISVKSTDNKVEYITQDRTLVKIANEALVNPHNNYILIIDEINRANLPSVLGELIYGLEYRGEEVNSLYELDGDTRIEIPKNLYIIGTMNTADRSATHIDYAIRRRFSFIEILPEILEDNFQLEHFKKVSSLFIKNVDNYLNDNKIKLERSIHLSEEFSPKDVWLGHSYFIASDEDFIIRKKYEIKPILEEYLKNGILKHSTEIEDLINNL